MQTAVMIAHARLEDIEEAVAHCPPHSCAKLVRIGREVSSIIPCRNESVLHIPPPVYLLLLVRHRAIEAAAAWSYQDS